MKISEEEREHMKLQHIKSLMLDYRYSRYKRDSIKLRIDELNAQLDCGTVGSIGFSESGGGAPAEDHCWITEVMIRRDELIEEYKLYSGNVSTVDEWLSALDEKHDEALRMYIIAYNCKSIDECAERLELKNKKALQRIVRRSLRKISQII